MRSLRFLPEKLIDAADYLLRHVGPCTRMKLVKLLYLADRYHLARHGTPVLGDRYYRLPWGPLPSRSLDVLEAAADVAARDPEAPADELSERLLARIEVSDPESKYARYISRGVGQPEYLSRSEIEALDAVAHKFGGWSAADLSNLTHRHHAFLKTKPQDEIDYRLFFVDEPEVKPEAVEYYELAEQDHDLLSRLQLPMVDVPWEARLALFPTFLRRGAVIRVEQYPFLYEGPRDKFLVLLNQQFAADRPIYAS